MIRRPRRTGAAVVVALAVFALCLVTVISLIQKLTGGKELVSYDSVATRLHDIGWSDPIVAAVGAAVIVLGLLLLALALLPGRPVVLPLADLDGSAAGVTRRSVRAALTRELDGLPGVDARRIRVGRRTIRVAATSVPAPGEIPPESVVGESISNALQRIGLSGASVRTRVRELRKEGRR
ncbi:hypothetical protein D7D52_25875 [Nocardia yunnanensis]|uniref:DUF6286 domain-containing protein n=1 Tax=Nocardia yunnanensis TaxID=2382165 RepID=A0A386ZJB6_9NOCA|nr:DUF6286 domain-containing protein [Nocardia yunnanensis]AYF76675.1 hypothetical protein D7D52_25875 [Nocardia yunnanensis]